MSKVVQLDNLKPLCHYKAIIQTHWLCVYVCVGGGVEGERGYLLLLCHVCLHPLFPQAFWGHGSFSLGDQVNRGEVTEAGYSHRRLFQTGGGGTAAGDWGIIYTFTALFSVHQHFLLLGLESNTRWNQHRPSGLIRLLFCKQPWL